MSDVPVLAKGVYVHSKTGKQYEVLGVAMHTETNEYLVTYRPAYPCQYELFVRPYAMFTERVEVDDKTVDRFSKV